jgi:hypothetical protein
LSIDRYRALLPLTGVVTLALAIFSKSPFMLVATQFACDGNEVTLFLLRSF